MNHHSHENSIHADQDPVDRTSDKSNGLMTKASVLSSIYEGKHNKDGQNPTPEQIASLIAQEMTRMTMAEREKALDDVHGIGRNDGQTPEETDRALTEMLACLDQMKRPDSAFCEAERKDPSYLRSIYHMFLMAELGSPDAAAGRMIRFFDLKKRLFGTSKLTKDITLKDLNEDDMDTLRSGCGQVSPYKDMAGRPILVFLHQLRRYKEVDNVLRATYYIFMSAMESVHAQQRGLTAIYWLLGVDNTTSFNNELRSSLPVNFAALHLCYDIPKEFAACCAAISTLNTQHRMRYRPHFGTCGECLRQLQTYGIPMNAIPMSVDGSLLTNAHMAWLEGRHNLETVRATLRESSSSKNFVPGTSVGLGAGGSIGTPNHSVLELKPSSHGGSSRGGSAGWGITGKMNYFGYNTPVYSDAVTAATTTPVVPADNISAADVRQQQSMSLSATTEKMFAPYASDESSVDSRSVTSQGRNTPSGGGVATSVVSAMIPATATSSSTTSAMSVASASTAGTSRSAIFSDVSRRGGATPCPEDVLFGRGKTVVEHPGNTRFRQVVDVHMSQYEAAGRLEKTCIAEIIVRMVKDSNGRFLKRDTAGEWEEADDNDARKKVAHAFRNRRKLHGYRD